MRHKYIEISPELILQMFTGSAWVERADGTLDKISSNIPADARVVKVWASDRDGAMVGPQDVCLMLESESFPDVPIGFIADRFRVECTAERGHILRVTDDEFEASMITRGDKIIEASLR